MAVQNDKGVKKRSERMLIALLIVTVPMFLGMLLAASGLDRGAPSTVVLTKSGCEVVRLAKAEQAPGEQPDTCVVRGYYRQGVFSDGAKIDQGAGRELYLNGGQIVGRVGDDSFSAPASEHLIWQRWIGLGIVAGCFLLLLGAYFLPLRRNHEMP